VAAHNLGFAAHVERGALCGLTTVILVLLNGRSHILYTMLHDGLLPRLFAQIHPRLQTPCMSQVLIGLLVAITAALPATGLARRLTLP
jgi:APA family basic amino acid/polyamine antiporter